jgi:hypothetical protein
MSTTNKSAIGLNWILTLVSLVALAAFLMFKPEWCWLAFPFVGTFMAKAFDVI